jgi:hypothetical protein
MPHGNRRKRKRHIRRHLGVGEFSRWKPSDLNGSKPNPNRQPDGHHDAFFHCLAPLLLDGCEPNLNKQTLQVPYKYLTKL